MQSFLYCESQIKDKEFLFDSWEIIKELYNVYSRETLRYLEDNIKRISSIAFIAATEKLKKEDKERLKKIRKPKRQKS